MDVSENSGTPQIIHFNRVFHYKPSIWGTTILGNPHILLWPDLVHRKILQAEHAFFSSSFQSTILWFMYLAVL